MGEFAYNSWSKAGLPAQFGLGAPAAVKALVGWGGLALKDGVDPVEPLRAYLAMVQEESCGRCIPCRIGSKIILDRLTAISQGQGRPEDLDLLERVAVLARDGSLCELGQSFPLPLLDALQNHRGAFVRAIEGKAASRNGLRYHKIYTAPCRQGCPAHLDVPRYLEEIKAGDHAAALATIRERTILAGVLGRVCVNPCEDNCRRSNLDEPLSIRCQKRFVADFELSLRRKPVFKAPAAKAARVAIIGGGPAGLSCAYQLGLKGYQSTIFEALPKAGGMLAVGIPEYRLPRDVLQGEIDLLAGLGVEIRLNTRVGRDVSFDDLRRDYQAVFIAAGLHGSASMGCGGEDDGYRGYMPGVEFLRLANLGQDTGMGQKVAVVGGGNVAMDCARVALRLGAEAVYLIYRRSRAEMPAHAMEVAEAEHEGVQYHFLANPTRIIAEDGRVVGVECIRMELGEPDASGRRRPVPKAGSEFVLAIDTLIPAIGQAAVLDFLPAGDGVKVNKWGNIEVDPVTLATGMPGVFAGGDLVSGARTAVEAVAAGNRAAAAISSYLETGQPAVDDNMARQAYLDLLGCYDRAEQIGLPAGRPRQYADLLPLEERQGNFSEVEQCFAPPAAINEAERCLRCYRLALVAT